MSKQQDFTVFESLSRALCCSKMLSGYQNIKVALKDINAVIYSKFNSKKLKINLIL